MGVITASSFPMGREVSNYDEVSMQQSLMFSDNLKYLKNLRAQLYSAAEYFELSYTNDDQKQIVAETLKDYAVKALVNTVDHLGSVTYKVNHLLDEKVDEVSGAELRMSCVEQHEVALQRLQTCLQYIDHEARTQQSLVIKTPKFHKQYILPVGETMHGSDGRKLKYHGNFIDDGDDWHQFGNVKETPPPVSKWRSTPQRSSTFSFTSTVPKKGLDKRTVSPRRFPLLRSGSVTSRSATPDSSRPTTPNTSSPSTPNLSLAGQSYPLEQRKSSSMWLHARMDNGKNVEQYPSKSKRLLKAILSRRKLKKDDMLYMYLDEY